MSQTEEAAATALCIRQPNLLQCFSKVQRYSQHVPDLTWSFKGKSYLKSTTTINKTL